MGLFCHLPFNYCTNQVIDCYHLSQWQSMGLEYLQLATMVTKVDQSVFCIAFPKQNTNHAATGQTGWNGEYTELGLFSKQIIVNKHQNNSRYNMESYPIRQTWALLSKGLLSMNSMPEHWAFRDREALSFYS